MNRSESPVCPTCGARLSEGATSCDLCGTDFETRPDPTSAPEGQPAEAPVPPPPDAGAPAPVEAEAAAASGTATGSEADSGSVYCNQCGWQNPSGARFCSACGAPLQVIQARGVSAPPPGTRPASGLRSAGAGSAAAPASSSAETTVGAPRTLALVLAGLVVVATLYLVTYVSKQTAQPQVVASEASIAESDLPPTEALPESVAARVSQLEQEAAGLSGEAQVEKRRELVNLLIGVGRPDRAAIVQETIAGAVGTGEEWYRAGNLYYDWMDQLDESRKFQVATRATAAYERGLEIGPDDLDVRTTLAMTYLYTSNPMRGVTTIKAVLDAEPEHLQANFYYGVMLMQINRLDQAIEQFEVVQGLVPEDHPIYRQAEALVEELKTFQAGS